MAARDQIKFQIYLTMVWVSYLQAILVSPGSPPANFQKLESEWERYCQKCKLFKPERSHHCKTCNQCVLRMDHHCPWTYNCVGYGNSGHFLRFLGWVLFATGYVMVELGKKVFQYYEDHHLPSYLINKVEMVAVIFLLPVDLFVFCSIGILFFRCIANWGFKGMTQIEVWEWERIESQFHTERLWTQIRENYLKYHGKVMPKLTSWNYSGVTAQQADRQEDGVELDVLGGPEENQQESTSLQSPIVPQNYTPDDLVFPYDLGFWDNLVDLCGFPLVWLLPTPWPRKHVRGHYPIKSEYFKDDQLELPWPPDFGVKNSSEGVQLFQNDTYTDFPLKDGKSILLLRKRLDPRSVMERNEWMNDLGERLDDYGVDVETE